MSLIVIDLVLVVLAVFFVASGLRVVNEHERLALVRLGRYIGIRGPGLVFILPAVDKAVRVDLNRDVPDWRSLTTEQLTERIRERASMGWRGTD